MTKKNRWTQVWVTKGNVLRSANEWGTASALHIRPIRDIMSQALTGMVITPIMDPLIHLTVHFCISITPSIHYISRIHSLHHTSSTTWSVFVGRPLQE